MGKADRKEALQQETTRALMNIEDITDYSLITSNHDELVFYIISPTNLSVLSQASVGTRIYALMTSAERNRGDRNACPEQPGKVLMDNKQFLRTRLEQEDNPAIRKLLEKDQNYLDRIQTQMATAREFMILLRIREEEKTDIFPYLSRIEKSLKEQEFHVKRAEKEDIRRILAVYFEQNVTTEHFEDSDGERWIIPDD